MTSVAAQDVWRAETPYVLAALARRHNDLADCEDAVQEALLAAATQWPRDGLPDNPRAWLVRVASRRLIDQVRSDTARRAREVSDARREGIDRPDGQAVADPAAAGDAGDDTLELLLLCCHPALTPSSQVGLMLRAVAGLTTAQIAAGFLVPEATMAQRISRAKATIGKAGARFGEIDGEARALRMPAVRHALALLFSEGHTRTAGSAVVDGAFAREAIRLARELHRAAPGDPENAGLLALLILTAARFPARVDAAGDLVPLSDQDRRQWDRVAIAEGTALIEAALPDGPVGEFQVQAAIAAVHAEAADAAQTDWAQILVLYRMLESLAPSLATTLGYAAALAEVHGPQAGLDVLDDLDGEAAATRNHRYHAVRGHLLLRAGAYAGARVALAEAARLTASIPEQRYLNRLIASVPAPERGP